jgi:hypothetical protein
MASLCGKKKINTCGKQPLLTVNCLQIWLLKRCHFGFMCKLSYVWLWSWISNAKFPTFTALIALVISAKLMKISSRGSGWVFWRWASWSSYDCRWLWSTSSKISWFLMMRLLSRKISKSKQGRLRERRHLLLLVTQQHEFILTTALKR